MKVNENKLRRQNEGIVKYIAAGAKGTFEWATGMGKTFAAFLIIREMQKRDPSRTTVVIVPTLLFSVTPVVILVSCVTAPWSVKRTEEEPAPERANRLPTASINASSEA